jgi:hypothetical protein
MIVTTLIIRKLVPFLRFSEKVDRKDYPSEENTGLRALGFWIGFFETLLIFMFVAQNEYGALAIVMAAKEFVRKEKVAENAAYYLLGTLINLSVAVLFALIAGMEW